MTCIHPRCHAGEAYQRPLCSAHTGRLRIVDPELLARLTQAYQGDRQSDPQRYLALCDEAIGRLMGRTPMLPEAQS